MYIYYFGHRVWGTFINGITPRIDSKTFKRQFKQQFLLPMFLSRSTSETRSTEKPHPIYNYDLQIITPTHSTPPQITVHDHQNPLFINPTHSSPPQPTVHSHKPQYTTTVHPHTTVHHHTVHHHNQQYSNTTHSTTPKTKEQHHSTPPQITVHHNNPWHLAM